MKLTIIVILSVCLLIACILQEIHSKALGKQAKEEHEVDALHPKEDLQNKNSVKVSKKTLNHLITGLIGLLININPPPDTSAANEDEE